MTKRHILIPIVIVTFGVSCRSQYNAPDRVQKPIIGAKIKIITQSNLKPFNPMLVGLDGAHEWTLNLARSITDSVQNDSISSKLIIHFASSSAEIKPEELHRIKSFVDLNADAEYRVMRVIGYTDSSGSNRINEPLSEKRAQSTRLALMACGIPEDRISCMGLSSDKPISENTTSEGRSQNRRVEIILEP